MIIPDQLTLSSAVTIMQHDNRLQFTRSAWDPFGVIVSCNRIYIRDGKLIYCTYDGTEDAFTPQIEDLAATDWRVLE